MIIGGDRKPVIENIKKAANARDFTAKGELGDPEMSLAERSKLVADFWDKQNQPATKLNNATGHLIADILARKFNHDTRIKGLSELKNAPQHAIITCNHFNQIDALAVKYLTQKVHHKLSIVIEDTNLKLPGILSYLMNNIGTIPLLRTPNYVGRDMPEHIKDAMAKNNWVLIFPEQEMWWNYRKPRKPQRGAYYYAARLNVPIISLFIEIQDTDKVEKDYPDFYETRYVIHVLKTIYPDPTIGVNAAASKLAAQDYAQKVAAYEECYGKKLNYDFQPEDIAGWRGK